MSEQFDDAIAGAGILGLAHAYHLAKRGRRVIVFERGVRATGASIRNFGMLWPIGQAVGQTHETALRSREIWSEVLRDSGLWHEFTGSLHLAYHDDEAQVLAEFTQSAPANGYDCALLTPAQALEKSQAVKAAGLKAALWSPTEICVDPREIIAGLPDWLTRTFGVRFAFGCAVASSEPPSLLAGGKTWRANNLYVCTGDDFRTLYPELLQSAGFIPCKLQMMRAQPGTEGWRLGPMLAAGSTLRHYKAFEGCPTLPAVRERFAQTLPEYDRYGIHVMASQNGRGELVLGDSHEYGDQITPFDKPEIDALILRYLDTFLNAPGYQITSRWHGIYAKHPTQPWYVARPASGVTIVTGVGGAGMTLSFGLAEQVVRETLGEG